MRALVLDPVLDDGVRLLLEQAGDLRISLEGFELGLGLRAALPGVALFLGGVQVEELGLAMAAGLEAGVF